MVQVHAIGCVLALGAATAAADSPCDKGYRDTSAAERGTMMRILEAVRPALPPAPKGWVVVNDDPPSVPQSLCMDYERKPWSYDYSRSYRRTDKQAEYDAGVRAGAEIMQADLAKKKPRLDAIMAKNELLAKQQVAFIEKGQMDKALALNEQMAALQEEYRKIADEGDAVERSDAIMREAMRDIEFSISVRVNAWAASPPREGDVAFAVPGGAHSAIRWPSRREDSHQGGAQVLYGQWRTVSSGSLVLVARGHVPANAAHGILVQIDADERRLDAVLGLVDFAALARLVAP
jgi:hypothetical protein